MSEKDEKKSSKGYNNTQNTHKTTRPTTDELGTQKEQQAQRVKDDPCRGGYQEEQLKLSHFQQVISSGEFPTVSVLSDNISIQKRDDSVVNNKPQDLRMYGA